METYRRIPCPKPPFELPPGTTYTMDKDGWWSFARWDDEAQDSYCFEFDPQSMQIRRPDSSCSEWWYEPNLKFVKLQLEYWLA